jgi:hypothetical protein
VSSPLQVLNESGDEKRLNAGQFINVFLRAHLAAKRRAALT